MLGLGRRICPSVSRLLPHTAPTASTSPVCTLVSPVCCRRPAQEILSNVQSRGIRTLPFPDPDNFDEEKYEKNLYYRDLVKMAQRKREVQAQFDEIKDQPVELVYKEPTAQAWVVNMYNERQRIMSLNPEVWHHEIRGDIVQRAVEYHRKLMRQGGNVAKTRGTRKGSSRKIRPQKGSGRARLGTARSPMLIGGGKAHGPVLRSFKIDLPKKVRWKALKVVLTAKYLEGNLHVVEAADFDTHKTADLVDALRENWDLQSVLMLHGYKELDSNLALAARNVRKFDFMHARSANVFDILKRRQLIVTAQAVEELEERLLKDRSGIAFLEEEKLPQLAYEELGPDVYVPCDTRQKRLEQRRARRDVLKTQLARGN